MLCYYCYSGILRGSWLSKISKEESLAIANGVRLAIAGITFLVMLATLMWHGFGHFFRFEQSLEVQKKQQDQISDLQSIVKNLDERQCNELVSAYSESLKQCSNRLNRAIEGI